MSPTFDAYAHLGIFGRAPVPGRTKTRLIPALGPAGAASLYAAMLQDVLDHARAARGFARVFWSADDTPSPRLDELLGDVPRLVQCEGELGARMHHAFIQGCRRHGRALLVGSDAPTLPPEQFEAAAEALEHADVVLCPSDDGGYTLIGARRVAAGMFEGVRFSTCHTRSDTERALAARGLSIAHLPNQNDVDTPDDLTRLRAELAQHPGRAPATARWLRDHPS